MQKAVVFLNPTDKPFSHTWDNVPYTFHPNRRYFLEDWKAHHFAKHLANFILNTKGLPVTDSSRESILKTILPPEEESVEAEDTSKLETELLNRQPPEEKTKKDKVKKPVGRPPKAVKSTETEEKAEEDTFEGLN